MEEMKELNQADINYMIESINFSGILPADISSKMITQYGVFTKDYQCLNMHSEPTDKRKLFRTVNRSEININLTSEMMLPHLSYT